MVAIASSLAVERAPAATAVRDQSLDTLRATTTLLVLFHHTAITYGGSGSWYYREITHGGGVSSDLLSLFTATNQAWFMGLFFLLAGYFTPGAVARHGRLGYLRERALRLGLPLLIYGFVIGPATKALGATASGHDFIGVLLRLWGRTEFESGPLWFAEALLIFAVLYALVAGFVANRPAPPFPSNRALLTAAALVGAAAFVIRLWWSTGENVLGLQFGYFASYVALFAAGAAAWRWPTLDRAPEATRRLFARVALITFFVLPLAFFFWPRVTGQDPEFSGGWSVPALIYAFWEPFVALGVILSLLHLFRTRWSSPGPIMRNLARRAFTIYIIHPPFIVAIALAWRFVGAPALIKFLVTGSLACIACYFVAGLILAIPGVRRVL